MATEAPLMRDGSQTTAAADLSAKQYYAVKLTAARAVNLASTGGEFIYGILQNKPVSGASADVGLFGVSKAIAGATFSAGDFLMTDTSGKLIAAVTTSHRVAQALEAATAANQICTVMVNPGLGTVA